ncbi:25046_t:CDS:2, partial [Gigaspora rosea]
MSSFKKLFTKINKKSQKIQEDWPEWNDEQEEWNDQIQEENYQPDSFQQETFESASTNEESSSSIVQEENSNDSSTLTIEQKNPSSINKDLEILFSQATINNNFQDGFTIEDTINDLISKLLKVENLPIIE